MIDKQQVEYIAELARLELKDEEIERMREDLSNILEYFEMLKKIDVSDVDPTFYPFPLKNIYRDDEIETTSPQDRDLLIRQSQALENDYIKVKEILKGPDSKQNKNKN